MHSFLHPKNISISKDLLAFWKSSTIGSLLSWGAQFWLKILPTFKCKLCREGRGGGGGGVRGAQHQEPQAGHPQPQGHQHLRGQLHRRLSHRGEKIWRVRFLGHVREVKPKKADNIYKFHQRRAGHLRFFSRVGHLCYFGDF